MVAASIYKKRTMKKEKITIAGKEVTLAYCYATEIAYKEFTGEDISSYMKDAFTALNEKPIHMPDVKKTIYVILAAAMAYSNSQNEDAAIKDADLMNDATPQELGTALGTVLSLYTQFYTLPTGDKADESNGQEDGKKN
jgi:hypothetical protein